MDKQTTTLPEFTGCPDYDYLIKLLALGKAACTHSFKLLIHHSVGYGMFIHYIEYDAYVLRCRKKKNTCE